VCRNDGSQAGSNPIGSNPRGGLAWARPGGH
jgi:hypothetical protein